ncbi:hypothetical protein ASF04_07935 [Duganella sp. Leaf61]|uniref:hypothetical protein n=1 Tax=Duganella sp. Leaf61 TaxID=1736227 RepID=UPI0006F3179C|nr:hypothetical protein [Duganella sp. Leaf61]KQN73053.1 hypothetical protein ASF04_07935 [Duganella sp. Leaf61]
MTAHANLMAELRHADHIIRTMLNAMTVQQQARVGAKLEADGVADEGMTRHHERAAVIAAAAAPASASAQLLRIEQQATDILSQADHADILLQALFDKLDPVGDTSPEVAAINCFATCTARAVLLMREAADNIVALVAEGGAA